MRKIRSLLLLFLVAFLLSGCGIIYNNDNNTSSIQETDYEEMYNNLAKEYDTLKMDRDRKVKEYKELKRKYQDLLEETDTSDMQAYILDKDFNVVNFNIKSSIKSSKRNYVEYFSNYSLNKYTSTIYICSKKEIKEIILINSNGEQEKVKKRKIEKETYVIDVQPDIFDISTIMIKDNNKKKYYFSFYEM